MRSPAVTITTASFLSLILLLALAGSAVAADYRAADRVHVASDETVDDDLYVAARPLKISARRPPIPVVASV